MNFSKNTIPDILDWLLSVVEPCIVLLIAFVLFYAFAGLLFGIGLGYRQRLSDSIRLLSENWKAGLILLVPLFYRTVRMFLEQVEEAFGMKKKGPMTGVPEEESRPAGKP